MINEEIIAAIVLPTVILIYVIAMLYMANVIFPRKGR